MAERDLKKAVYDLAHKVGRSEVRRQLVMAGASPHTADKLLRGKYPSEVGHLLGAAIEKALAASKPKAS